MPVESRTFRLFVSSTFDDLRDERDALQREVFPKLRELCRRHGARFQAIDLRWGVRTEAAADHRTMEICLSEIERCRRTGFRPNFFVLLGDRYGWRPVPARIPAPEFERVRGPLATAWYELDQNAVPGEYVLKPRSLEFPEAELHAELLQGARRAGLSVEDLLRYEASAVHQEILQGLGTTPANREHVFAFCRRARRGIPQDPALATLKNLLPDITYFDTGALPKLCADVYAKLERVILAELGRFASRPSLEVQIEAHDAFGREKTRNFVGRADTLGIIREYLDGGERRAFVLHGASGSGKSAVLAHASLRTDVIRRFVGATPESGNAVALLTGLCRQMGMPHTGPRLSDLAAAFQQCLTHGTREHPLLLFLDGIDQSEDLTWLPSRLPPHCRLVISAARPIPGCVNFELVAMPAEDAGDLIDLWLKSARRTLNAGQRQEVMRTFASSGLPLHLKLAFEEARRWRSFDLPRLGEGIDGVLGVMNARLSDDRNHGPVLTGRGLGYLTAARDGVTEDEMVDLLSNDKPVREDFEARARHVPPGPNLPVIVWLRLLMDIEPYLVEITTPGGTVVTWQHRQLREWFAALYDREDAFRPHSVLAGHFSEERSEPLWLHDTTRADRVPNYRKLRELPYQQTVARMHEQLATTLGNLAFLEAKSFAEMEYDLLTDCERATALVPAAAVLNATLSRAVQQLRARPDHILQTLYNRLLWIVDDFPALSRSLERARDTLDRRGPWLELQSKPAHEPSAGSVSYQMPFGSAVQAVLPEADLLAFARYDGKVSAHRLSTGQELFTRSLAAGNVAGISLSVADPTIAYVDRNGTIGVEPGSITLPGRRRDYLVFYDGRWVLAARQDHALVAWRPEDGYCAVLDTTVPEPLVVLRPAASGTVLCVAGVRGREQKLGTIRIGADGCTYQAIPYQGEQILDAELDAAGERIVAACADRCIRILDASTGNEIRALAYERLEMPTVTGRPERCCFAGGAMTGRAVFSTADAYIAGWDWQGGRVEVFSSADREGGVHAYQMLRGLDSGRILATRLKDVALLAPWTPLRSVAPHQRPVTSVNILHTGQAVSFSAADRSLVWYTSDGAPESRRNILNATAMTVLPGTSDVVVADSRGAVWKERPGGNRPPEGSFSTEGAVALCSAGFGWVAVGAASGSILRVDAEAKLARVVRPPVWGLRQVDLIPAGRCGLCWTREVATVRGGIRTVLALVTAAGRERCKLRVEAHAVATGDEGSTLCYADASGVYVRRRRLLWFFPAYRKIVNASQLAVLDSTGLLAVSRADDHWLEIWRLRRGLPVVSAAELPDDVTCMAAQADRVVIGFSSGEVLWFRLRKAARKS